MTRIFSTMRNALNEVVPVNGERLRGYRKLRQMTQMDLASVSGVSRSYIAEIERGVKRPRYLVADDLAEALDIEVDDLVSTQALER